MRIAVDVMGADKTPGALITGGLLAAKESEGKIKVILVGDKDIIQTDLKSRKHVPDVEIVHAPDFIPMEQHAPAKMIRKMETASIVVATSLQKENKADAVVSAGSTGAAMATAFFKLGRLKGVSRPAICTPFPTEKGACVVLDVGANSDCKPQHLFEFGIMGKIYSQKVLGTNNPSIGLLNIGEEPTKGNDLTINAYKLFAKCQDLNFIGNVEGRDVLKGTADVVVCDGFVGNIILKFTESVYSMLKGAVKRGVMKSLRTKIGAYLVKPAMQEIAKELDYAEYGGAPLLGINGVSIICHGGSTAKAIKNAVFAAERSITNKVNDAIKREINKYNLDEIKEVDKWM
jgi:glycerol-3-phosphate acyltransferase PlsX